MIHIPWLGVIIGLFVGLLVGTIVTVVYYAKGLSRKQQLLAWQTEQAALDAKQLIVEAKKTGERKKRELLLEAKEEIHKAKVELEKDVKDRKVELQRDRNRIDQKEENLDRKLAQIEVQEKDLHSKVKYADQKQVELEQKESQLEEELCKIAALSMDEAKTIVLDQAKETFQHDMAVMFKQMKDETTAKADLEAVNILAATIQRYAADYVSESTVTVVNLPNDDMKGRIIGREGRNIRAIETLTGVDLIIDDTPEAVILSCFNPIQREVARLALEKLIQDGRIHPARIEEAIGKAKKELDQVIKAEGEKTAFETGVMGLDEEIIRMLGRMRYRTSYRQNALKHSIEVCWFSGMMAAELGLDVNLAKRAGLLHDIGKAIDFEMDGTHVELGVEIASKHNEHPVVLNSIEAHHGVAEPISPISVLVTAADALSAARPGARQENIETYVKRIQKLEEIAKDFNGVENCFAIQAGREIRVMVMPDQVRDDEMDYLSNEICKRIENEVNYPGMIKVSMIRETRATGYAR